MGPISKHATCWSATLFEPWFFFCSSRFAEGMTRVNNGIFGPFGLVGAAHDLAEEITKGIK